MTLQADFRIERGGYKLQAQLQLATPITALFGSSGAGKTTLLHVLAGLLRPTSGHVRLGDRVLDDVATGVHLSPPRRRVGLVFQDLRLFPNRNVEDNLMYGLRRQPPARQKLHPGDVIDALAIADLLLRRPHQLSGGERQRVALGRALLAMPDLLLMDEPLASVDWKMRRQILPYLRWVQESLQVPVLYVSHSLPEILELTDQVVVLEQGRVRGHGEVFEVLGNALQGPHAENVATESVLPVTVVWPHEEGWYTRGRIGEQELSLPFDPKLSTGHRSRVAVRPDDVMLATQELSGVSARNQLRGEVTRLTPLHGRLLVHVALGDGAIIRAELTRHALSDLALDVGSSVVCVVKTSSFRWLLG